MTREESTAKLVQLRADAEALVKKYNEAIQTGKYEDAHKADSEMTDKVNEYTGIVRDMCFAECKASGDPMMAAVRMLYFTTIGVKDEQKGDDKVPVRSIIEKDRQIDLLKLDKYCDGIGADKNWVHIVMKLNFLLTAQKCADLGIDPKSINDSYAMSDIARQYDMGKNPTSKTNLLKTLQKVITAMLGDGYKATSHDVNFLLSVFSRKNRAALTVTCANHRYMRNYVAEICHRIVTGKSYQVDYRKSNGGVKTGSQVTTTKDESKSKAEDKPITPPSGKADKPQSSGKSGRAGKTGKAGKTEAPKTETPMVEEPKAEEAAA